MVLKFVIDVVCMLDVLDEEVFDPMVDEDSVNAAVTGVTEAPVEAAVLMEEEAGV